MKRVIGISAVALLALAACAKKTETAATGTTAPATASAPAAPMTAPTRKAGLWTQTINAAGMNQTIKMCLDAASDEKMKWWGSSQAGKSSNCTEEHVTPHVGGGWDFHSVCKMGESGVVTSDGSATGDFGSHYRVDVNSVTSGSPMPQANGAHKISIEATWNGPCPADMKGGDMEMPGGMRININGAMSGGPGAAMGAGGHMTSADIAKMRAQAMSMAKAAREQEGK